MSTYISALIDMHKRNADVLPEIPCAQAYNTWNPNHKAHDWYSKRTFPGQDAHCPGSVLGS